LHRDSDTYKIPCCLTVWNGKQAEDDTEKRERDLQHLAVAARKSLGAF